MLLIELRLNLTFPDVKTSSLNCLFNSKSETQLNSHSDGIKRLIITAYDQFKSEFFGNTETLVLS